jgi:cystathionine gamma-synthase
VDDETDSEYHLETLAVHAGRGVDPATGAVAPAIYPSSTFLRRPDGGVGPSGFGYGREGHPNSHSLEIALAALEGGAGAVAFASGSAAMLAVLESGARRGRVIVPEAAYHGTLAQARELLPRWGAQVARVDTTCLQAVEQALSADRTALLVVETPANPALGISDLAAIGELCEARGVMLACDNTFATPILQKPLALGAGLVVHSTTKYIGGHSDLLGGAVVAADPGKWLDDVDRFRTRAGASPSAFDCWLLTRSLPTLPWRVRAQSEHAARIANFLADHPGVAEVMYPGLEDHPGHAVAARQMSGFGAMLAFRVAAGRRAAMGVTERTRLFTRATSLGGVESLIEHRASVEGPDSGIPEDLLRLSVGLEHPDDLVADLAAALG